MCFMCFSVDVWFLGNICVHMLEQMQNIKNARERVDDDERTMDAIKDTGERLFKLSTLFHPIAIVHCMYLSFHISF